MSTQNISPATFLGGTWEKFGQGRTLIGVNSDDTDFSSSKLTGGNKTTDISHTHTIPAHSHGLNSHTHTIPAHNHENGTLYAGLRIFGADSNRFFLDWNLTTQNYTRNHRVYSTQGIYAADTSSFSETGSERAINVLGSTANSSVLTSGAATGSTTSTSLNTNTSSVTSINNMPPYITCYMWTRIA